MSTLCVKTVLDGLFEAWANKDPVAVAHCFASHGVYNASIGVGPGETAVGRTAIRALVSKLMKTDLGSVPHMDVVLSTDNQAVFRWTYTFPDGSKEYGCDLIEVEAGKITLKDAYRKVKAS